MTNEEYYRNWAKEYEATINDLAERIDDLRAKMKGASPSELVFFENRISILCAMRTDNIEVMNTLIRKALREKVRCR